MTSKDLSAIVGVVLLSLSISTALVHSQPAAAVVSGIVVSNESPTGPVRRATVSLVSADLRVPLSTITDDGGRFSFATVPAGHYSVVASKPSYVGTFYGSKRPGRGPGVPVAVPPGGRVTDLRLTLMRGGVIGGLLRLPSGQPALNMSVTVVEIETINGERRLRLTGGRSTTDDRGQYRVYGLPPGQYIVQGQPSGLLTGAVSGANDAVQTTPSEVSWATQTARRSTASAPATIGASSASPPARGRTMQYAPSFYPGTADPSGAAAVQLGAGEERLGVDFPLALVPTARIAGTVRAPDGQPMANVAISIVAENAGLNLTSLLAPRAAVRSAADGTFAIPAVAPGRYQLAARVASDLWSSDELVIDGRDMTNLSVSLHPSMTVSGRLVFEGATFPAPSPQDLTRGRIALAPQSPAAGAAQAVAAGATTASAAVAADGTFVIGGVVPGLYRVSVSLPGVRANPSAPGDGWTLRSVAIEARDAPARVFEIRAGENVTGLVLQFTDRPTELAGTLTDQSGQPATGYPIVVFSTNRADWTAGSPRVAAARPSTDGTFRLVGLPAGPYYVCALVSLDQSDLDDGSFLEQLAGASLTITLAEGARLVQNLRVGGR